jgi:hypothetical protein
VFALQISDGHEWQIFLAEATETFVAPLTAIVLPFVIFQT